MMVMPANSSKALVHHWATKYSGLLGHLYGPTGQRGPYRWLPYALDNNRFPAWENGTAWSEPAYLQLLEWAYRAALAGQPPLWALVPDVVADRDGTLKEWDKWSVVVESYGFKLAFAVQDGMTRKDVPNNADVVFIGGTVAWKWKTAPQWCAAFPRVHIGRVNTYDRIFRRRGYAHPRAYAPRSRCGRL
ncbi:MAG TPA: hypothetical protein VF747_06365 [Blastocatellia bacterium]|jgi:hypothetical protein